MSVNLSAEEKVLYPFVGYGLVWGLLYGAGQHWFEPATGSALAGFIWILGFWFLPFAPRKRFSFVGWLGVSVLFAIAAFGIRYAVDRAFGA